MIPSPEKATDFLPFSPLLFRISPSSFTLSLNDSVFHIFMPKSQSKAKQQSRNNPYPSIFSEAHQHQERILLYMNLSPFLSLFLVSTLHMQSNTKVRMIEKRKERRYLGLSIQTNFPFFTYNCYFFFISIVINNSQKHFWQQQDTIYTRTIKTKEPTH
ncbi:hypothetical protein TorRG33x02_204790 [Trema orientale]|uniref:Transmembrane protein n=1 Tax=Trema orientale TaxID=63057 RepID=A0A2P5EDR1_TREOI|nr:hypothetical protein TorRG33x02_204790 [Trema orientale]